MAKLRRRRWWEWNGQEWRPSSPPSSTPRYLTQSVNRPTNDGPLYSTYVVTAAPGVMAVAVNERRWW